MHVNFDYVFEKLPLLPRIVCIKYVADNICRSIIEGIKINIATAMSVTFESFTSIKINKLKTYNVWKTSRSWIQNANGAVTFVLVSFMTFASAFRWTKFVYLKPDSFFMCQFVPFSYEYKIMSTLEWIQLEFPLISTIMNLRRKYKKRFVKTKQANCTAIST